MRRLLLFLLVINVAYFIWQLSMHDEAEGMIGSTVESIEPIFLLSEREPLPIAESHISEHQVAEVQGIEDRVAENRVTENADEQSEIVLHSPEKRLSEKDTGEKTDKIEEQADVEIVSKSACFTAGPFNDLEALRTLIDDIKNNVTDTKIRDQEEKKLSVFWVYINPEKSRKDAKTLGQNLKAKKIKDFYIIRSGEKNNGISLGHFKSKYRATKLTKRVKSLGFDVRIEPVLKAYTVYWLNYQMTKSENMPQMILDEYEKIAVNNKITVLRRDCVAK